MTNNGLGLGRYGAAMEFAGAIVESLIEASRRAATEKARGVGRAKGVRGASEAAEGVLWAALVGRVLPLLEKRGEKAKLARELGVSRQQVHAYFKARTAAPDAERTLRLILWLAQAEAQVAAAPVAPGAAGNGPGN